MKNRISTNQKKSDHTSRTAGFTLVEVLVALSIFSVAVTGIITVAYKGGVTANSVKNRVIATYLADEGIEMMRSLRDTAMLTPGGAIPSDYNWTNVFLPMFTSACTASNPCDINILGAGNTGFADATNPFPQSTDLIACPLTGCPLYLDNRLSGGLPVAVSYGYYLDNNGTISGSALNPSGFTRALVVSVTPEPSISSITIPEEAIVTATVTWHEGSILKTLVQTENLYDWY